jgi:uncharacterized cupin superfamily protein
MKAKAQAEIQVEQPSPEKLKEWEVSSWPIWECEPSTFPWHYEEQETCYLLEGKVKVKVKAKDSEVEFGKGGLVVFPQGLDCTWTVLEKVKKHYRFGG